MKISLWWVFIAFAAGAVFTMVMRGIFQKGRRPLLLPEDANGPATARVVGEIDRLLKKRDSLYNRLAHDGFGGWVQEDLWLLITSFVMVIENYSAENSVYRELAEDSARRYRENNKPEQYMLSLEGIVRRLEDDWRERRSEK